MSALILICASVSASCGIYALICMRQMRQARLRDALLEQLRRIMREDREVVRWQMR